MVTRCAFLLLCVLSTLTWEHSGEEAYSSAFHRFKMLEGIWHGKSTKGWENTESYRVIAKGSAVLSVSEFTDSPDEAMASVITMDQNNLLLTHYCEAGNQPVLRATRVEENGRKVTFEFSGGTNIPTRDVGHMDRVVVYFEDEDHFSSQWSWYANGKQILFETIRYERKR
jgi:hypothetical protein